MNLKFLNNEISSIHAAAFLLGAAGLLSRILGVARDRLLAAHFGAGRELDIYYTAFQIPDFMSVLFFLGAGSAAILPIFQEYAAKNRASAKRLISEISSLFFVGVASISFIVFIFAPFFMDYIAPGFSQSEKESATVLTRIMLFSPILLGFSSIFSAVIQSFKRFFVYALAPVFYNLGIIIGIAAFVPFWGASGLAFGVLLGALLHVGIQFAAVWQLGFLPYPARFWTRGVREIVRIAFPRALSIGLSHITLLVLVAIGSTLFEGSISVFNLAQNLYYVPVGVFGISYATAIFPRMSRAYIEKDAGEFFRELFTGIRTILFWVLPSAVLFIVLRAHIVRVTLGSGEFSWDDTRLTAASLAIFASAMGAGSLISLFLRGFYALEHTWSPFFINMGASLFSVLSAFYFIAILSSPSGVGDMLRDILRITGLPGGEVTGLALGFALGLIINAFFLYFSLTRKAGCVFGMCLSFPYWAVIKIGIASLLGGGAAYAVRLSFSETFPLITFTQVLAHGVLAGLAGILVYFAALFALKSEDVFALWASMEKKLLHIGVLPKYWDGEADIHQHKV